MSNDDLGRLGSELVTWSARLVRAVRHAVEQPPGVRVLSILDERGPLGITALAEADRCSQPTMSGTVSVLADRGWVRKVPHPADARSSLVELTTPGHRALADFRRAAGREIAGRLVAAGRHDADAVAQAVAVLRAVLSPTTRSTVGSTARSTARSTAQSGPRAVPEEGRQ
jgi:DNA-binding MarR family transcriptional regulator